MGHWGECGGEKMVYVGFIGICKVGFCRLVTIYGFLKLDSKIPSRTRFRFCNPKSNTHKNYSFFLHILQPFTASFDVIIRLPNNHSHASWSKIYILIRLSIAHTLLGKAIRQVVIIDPK